MATRDTEAASQDQLVEWIREGRSLKISIQTPPVGVHKKKAVAQLAMKSSPFCTSPLFMCRFCKLYVVRNNVSLLLRQRLMHLFSAGQDILLSEVYIHAITFPPHTGRYTPEINPARSDAKKQTAFAMSKSVPLRFIGTLST